MLAQNFKTAAELQLSDAELGVLIRTLGMLERGELSHRPDPAWEEPGTLKPNGFNMRWHRERTDCGTVACICGWAQTIDKTTFPQDFAGALGRGGLLTLFCPPKPINRGNITTEQAAIALRNYLTHGEPRWAEALTQ